jgi:biotin-(acetyl-CoA carboxylase) ligase
MHGTFEDVDEDGALVLRRADGSLSRIHAGEVFFRS